MNALPEVPRRLREIDEAGDRDLERLATIAAKNSSASTIATTNSDGKPRKQADILLDIGMQHDLFHDHAGTAYAQVRVRDHGEVHAIDSTAYRELLAGEFLEVANKGCNRNALTDAITTLSSLAKFRGKSHDVGLRTAMDADRIYIDTGRPDWQVIEIDPNGWRRAVKPPRFRRAGAPLSLPEPATPDFQRLWKYVEVRDEHKPLVAGFLLASLRPVGPFPQLHLSGEQGTGKSTVARVLKSLIDPSASPLRAPPKEVRDLLVGALNGWCLALDNLSFITPQLSDALCRLATGGAISERQLYTNVEEVLVEVQRPVIINGIDDLAIRPDLAERGLHIELELIRVRRSEREFWAAFKVDAPYIFGALLAGLSMALCDQENIDLGRLPRMADFALWAAAGMPALGFTAAEFMGAYRSNTEDGMAAGIDSSPIGRALLGFIRQRMQWSGTAGELLKAIAPEVDDATLRSPAWPKSPRGLSGVIRRMAPSLRLAGVDVDSERTATERRMVLCNRGKQPSLASQPSYGSHDGRFDDDCDGHDGQNRVWHGDGLAEEVDL
jgi:hypothetical protein